MLRDTDATTIVAVKDLEVARGFYEGKLGFTPADDPADGMVSYRSGASTIAVYESEFAGTNKANAVVWTVPDFDDVMRDLHAAGVPFEHYDLPGLTLEGDVHVAKDFKGAWFKDPDGNILHINGG